MSTIRDPLTAPSRKPASPATTSSTSGDPGSMVMKMSLFSVTALGESATEAPRATRCSALLLVRLWTTSSWPASRRLLAMDTPMIPSPTNPTFSTIDLLSSTRPTRSGRLDHSARRPGEVLDRFQRTRLQGWMSTTSLSK